MYYKIIIIGAGMAGLGAANKLDNNDFIILEAQDQPGGRIRTIEVDNVPLDLGAQWLHGKQNPLYEISIKHDLLSPEMSLEGEGKYIRDDGVVIHDDIVKSVDFKIGEILQECTTFVEAVDYPKSVLHYLEERFLEYLKQSTNDTANVKQLKLELLDWHIRFQVVDNSCETLDKLSAKHWGQYICIDDVAHYNFKYGYKSLINVLVNDLPENKIFLNTEVIKIEYDNKTNGQIKLYCNNDKIFLCDHLIITSSLGCLKETLNIFPGLPKSMTSSIDAMGWYGIGKIFLFFDHKWWDVPGFQMIWRKDTVLNDNEEWLRSITGFDSVFQQPNALLGWVGGSSVRHMESLSENEIGTACVRLLRRFLPDYDIPEPVKVVRTKWFSNRWIRGGYCHITPECDDSGYGIHKLGEPVFVNDVPRILLAGEAVHPSHYSTCHGAYESGQQQAAILQEYLRSPQAVIQNHVDSN